MSGIKLMCQAAVLAAMLTGCAENGGLLDAAVGVNIGNHGDRDHHDNGRHEGERKHHGHDGDDD